FVVASDEINTLYVYRRGHADPVTVVELHKFLDTKKDKESDLEGAARIGNRVYWISSHGTNSDGEQQDRRRRLFATDITSEAGGPSVKPVGSPYAALVADLISAPQLAAYDFATASTIPPKEPGGLNIEGLAATPDGRLLIGFRNPVPG